MSIFKNKKNDLYLSDKQPLTVGGKIALAISYIFLILILSILKGIVFCSLAREIDRNIKKISFVDSDHFVVLLIIITN